MKQLYLTLLLVILLSYALHAQVKSSYLYNTSMPYGTLDLRTRISSSDYFYLQENKTFSFRQSSPGVKTNTYLDMTSWDSSPFKQGNLRRKVGTVDRFVMNYRLLFPGSYNSTYAEGYPLLVLFHGGAERANCYYNNCYHATQAYNPNVNNPPAPTSATHKLLNNDQSLVIGAKGHMDAVNRAAGRLPNDAAISGRMFPGFVLVPQMMNVWDSLNVQDVARMIQLLCQKYKIDKNRIYVHGISIGGYATYEIAKRAPWLIAAAMPMSGVKDASIGRYNQQGKVAHIPFWIFQGGLDKNPSPTYTNKTIAYLKNAGALIRYTLYSDLGHTCWYRGFSEPEFYSWFLSKNKSNIHLYKGISTINTSTATYPKLMLAEGFFAYQWEKDGKIITGASANTYTAKSPGTYRARFSRVAAPTATQWNKWSAPVKITMGSTTTIASVDSVEVVGDEESEIFVYPNPSRNTSITVSAQVEDVGSVSINVVNSNGAMLLEKSVTANELHAGVELPLFATLAPGVYVITINYGRKTVRKKVIVD